MVKEFVKREVMFIQVVRILYGGHGFNRTGSPLKKEEILCLENPSFQSHIHPWGGRGWGSVRDLFVCLRS